MDLTFTFQRMKATVVSLINLCVTSIVSLVSKVSLFLNKIIINYLYLHFSMLFFHTYKSLFLFFCFFVFFFLIYNDLHFEYT